LYASKAAAADAYQGTALGPKSGIEMGGDPLDLYVDKLESSMLVGRNIFEYVFKEKFSRKQYGAVPDSGNIIWKYSDAD
jgi:hypothetical protein